MAISPVNRDRLAPVDPVLIDTVAITDQDACPVLDEVEKGRFGALGMNEIEGHGIGGHGPQPLQGVLTVPQRFVNVANWRLASEAGNGCIMGRDGVRGAIDELLDGPKADGHRQDGMAEILYEPPGSALHASHLAHEGGQARAITAGAWSRNLGFQRLPTASTGRLMQDECVACQWVAVQALDGCGTALFPKGSRVHKDKPAAR
jgi:hypothetical protein